MSTNYRPAIEEAMAKYESTAGEFQWAMYAEPETMDADYAATLIRIIWKEDGHKPHALRMVAELCGVLADDAKPTPTKGTNDPT